MEVINVTLESVVGNGTTQPIRKDFKFDHAAKLLKSESKGRGPKTWKLPNDSQYIFKDGNLIKRGGAQLDKSAKESTGDSAREGKEDPA